MIIRSLNCPGCARRINLEGAHMRIPYARPGTRSLAGERSVYKCGNCKASLRLRPSPFGILVLLIWAAGLAAAWRGGFNGSAILAISAASLAVLLPYTMRLIPVRDPVA